MSYIIDFERRQLLDAAQDFNKNILADNRNKIEKDLVKDAIESIERCAFALANDGLDPKTGATLTTDKMDAMLNKLSDASGIGSTAILTQQVLTRSLQHLDVAAAIHPHFATKMTYKTGTQVVIPYIGEATGARDIGPGQELPMISLDRDAEMISATGRAGIGITLPDETMRNSNYPILALYLQKAHEALAIWKDTKAVRMLLAEATAIFDNAHPSTSLLGYTSGRSATDQLLNGTFTLRDLHKMFQHLRSNGYTGDTILMSQWGYLLFMYEPILRQFIEFNNGVLFSTPQGTVGSRSRNEVARRSRETSPGDTYNNLAPNMQLPNQLASTNFSIIVTDYVPTYFEGDILYKSLERSLGTDDTPYTWDATNNRSAANITAKTAAVANCKDLHGAEATTAGGTVHCGVNPMTDIIMCNSYNALLYLEEEKPKVDRKYDNLYEQLEIYIRERYVFVKVEKGRAIVSARNLVITDDTHDFMYRAINTAEEMSNALAKGV